MMMLTALHGKNVVLVALRKYFTVFDGLNGGMVVILMDLTVNGGGSFFVTVLGDSLVGYRGSHLFVNGGVMVSSFGPEYVVSKSEPFNFQFDDQVSCNGKG